MSPKDDRSSSSVTVPATRGKPDARLGKVVGGKYRIERMVGQGGLGRVYEATHLTLGAPVAIKFMLAEAALRPEIRARFKREAAALSRLRHPGIVAAHDYGEDEGDLFIVMEFVRGDPLVEHIVVDGAALPFARIIGIFEQILQVVESAHGEGIVHRDLKPENVMLLEAGDRVDHVKVLDFGIALMDDREGEARLTATNAVQGTPMYMSPEQCRGRDVGPETDLYAIGVMLYEMLAGEPPFDGESLVDVMAQHLFVLPPPIVERGVQRHVPPELERLAKWAMAKKPVDRPTATQLRDALREITRGVSPGDIASRSTEERIRAMTMTRSERALSMMSDPELPTVLRGPSIVPGVGPLVLLCGFTKERASALAGALGANGIDARPSIDPESSIATLTGLTVKALVIAGGGAVALTTAMRATPAHARLPILVADVDDASNTAAHIRAGTSDVALGAVGDDVLCKKLLRLIERGR